MRYSGLTPTTQREMLQAIGVERQESLFASIPEACRMKRPLDVYGPLPESALLDRLDGMKVPPPRVSLVGAGLYSHYIPSVVDSLVNRSEWVTSYTPYQPEVSQGTLVMYYEFQTYVCQLTGQEIANGGLYDGSTALAEAVLMAKRVRPKAKFVYVSEAVHPEYRAVLATYLRFQDMEIRGLPWDRASGRTDFTSLTNSPDIVAVVAQTPNFFGVIEDFAAIPAGVFRIAVVNEAQSLALLTPPAADITVGEMQSLGIPIQLGGPTAGFFATRKEFVRQMPGRLVGRSLDRHGSEAYCITLATREQFIRREKATSNICTASGLMCLRSAVYLSLMGRKGLQDVARKSARAALAFRSALAELGMPTRFGGPSFNEFVVDARRRPGLYEALEKRGFLLGLPLAPLYPELEGHYLVALTEIHYPKMAELIGEVKSLAHHS